MPRGDVAEGQRRAQIDAAGGVVPAHDAGHVAARRIQTCDGLTCVVEDLSVCVDLEPGEGAEATGLDLHCVERALFDRRDAGVGLLPRIALLAVIGGRTATELRVFTVARMAVVVFHGAA